MCVCTVHLGVLAVACPPPTPRHQPLGHAICQRVLIPQSSFVCTQSSSSHVAFKLSSISGLTLAMAEFLVHPHTMLASFSLLTGSIPGNYVLFCPWKCSLGHGSKSSATSRGLIRLHRQRSLDQTRVRWNIPSSGASPLGHPKTLGCTGGMTNLVGKNGPMASHRIQPSSYVAQLQSLPSPNLHFLHWPHTTSDSGAVSVVARFVTLKASGDAPSLNLPLCLSSKNTYSWSLIFSPSSSCCSETAIMRLAGRFL